METPPYGCKLLAPSTVCVRVCVTPGAFGRCRSSLLDSSASLDAQVNWFQLSQAAAFLGRFPDTVVVVDHMGCLKLGQSVPLLPHPCYQIV